MLVDAADHSSLQDALDLVNANPSGGMVRLPPGRYEIEEPLRITGEDITLRGSGAASVIVNRNTEGKPAILVASGIPNPKRSGQQAFRWRIALQEFRIVGNEKSGHGIEAHNINEIHIRALTITENGGDGIHHEYCLEDARVSDCILTYNKGSGFYILGNHDIVVSANQFEENVDGLRCLEAFNLTMNGNILDDHLGNAIVLEKMMGSVLSGNMIEQSEGWGLVVDRDSYGLTFSGNIFTNNKAGGIDLRSAYGCTLSANTFARSYRNAVFAGKHTEGNTIAANTFTSGRAGNGQVFGNKGEPEHVSGIVLDPAAGALNVTGNTFRGVRPAAVTIESGGNAAPATPDLLFTGNLLVDTPPGTDAFENATVANNRQVAGRKD
ncbi:MAG: right-handed parallel beta-helix repeat-containing protein [Pirellulales bacterium]